MKFLRIHRKNRLFIRIFLLIGVGLFGGILCPAQAHDVRDSVLHIAGGTKSIKAREFEDRCDFHSVDFDAPQRLQSIGQYAFSGCKALRSLDTPHSLREISEGAFAWCPALKCVRMKGALTNIGSRAFAYCSAIETVEFPKGLKRIGTNAFAFCSNLEQADLPSSVSELESYAFGDCLSLRKVKLPATGAMLGELIFGGCRELEELEVSAQKVPEFECNSEPFELTDTEMYRKCVLRVVPGMEDAYRAHPAWGKFKKILSY